MSCCPVGFGAVRCVMRCKPRCPSTSCHPANPAPSIVSGLLRSRRGSTCGILDGLSVTFPTSLGLQAVKPTSTRQRIQHSLRIILDRSQQRPGRPRGLAPALLPIVHRANVDGRRPGSSRTWVGSGAGHGSLSRQSHRCEILATGREAGGVRYCIEIKPPALHTRVSVVPM